MKKINTEEEKYCVYRHVRLDTNETFYIGIGNKKRPYNKTGRSNFWKRIISKTDYRVDIIFENLSWEESCKLEKSLIWLYGRRDKKQGSLVNMTDGGDGTIGIIRSEEYRKKISIRNSNKIVSTETKLKISIGNTGKKRTEEFKKRVSIALTGKPKTQEAIEKYVISRKSKAGFIHSEETKDKIKKALLGKKRGGIKVIDTSTGKVYLSVKDVYIEFKIPRNTLHNWLTGKVKNKSTFKYL